jgi:hypothetical protein
MAILRRNHGWAALVGALLCLAGCVLVDSLVQAERPFAFSHRLHVGEKGLACADCHGSWDDSEDPGMPRAAQCALCHSKLDAEKPPELRVASLFEGDRFHAARAGAQSAEIVFSHQKHASRQECAACHAEVESDDGTLAKRGAELRTSMDACLACHAASSGPARSDCAACHTEIRAGVAPPSHLANWTRYHGTFVRGRLVGERSDQCALCHQAAECTTCHQIEPPVNHNNYWRRRGHGLTASMDRDSCETCHDVDSCDRCHDEIRPQSHVGSWGEPQDRHCLACHEPVRSQSCGVCHATTPSHDQATPLPPDHVPSMNCRQCHGNGQPLPHVDNGQTCTSCHR